IFPSTSGATKDEPIGFDACNREIMDFLARYSSAHPDDIFANSVKVATIMRRNEDEATRLKLAGSLFSAGVMQSVVNRDWASNNYLQGLLYLVTSQDITLADFLRISCSHTFSNSTAKWDIEMEKAQRLAICQMLRMARCTFLCDEWNHEDYARTLHAVPTLYAFLIDCVKNDLADEDTKDTRAKTEFERAFLDFFSRDALFVNLLKLSEAPQVDGHPLLRSEVEEARRQFDNKQIVFPKREVASSWEHNRSIVCSTISVFICARQNVHYDEMANELWQAAQMVDMDRLWMAKYALRTAIELMVETPLDSPLRPFVETFFLVRLPYIVADLSTADKYELLKFSSRDMVYALNRLPIDLWNLFQEELEKVGINGPERLERVAVERYNKTEPPCTLLIRTPIAIQAADMMKRLETRDEAALILPALFDGECIAFNCALAQLSVSGMIHRKTALLADLNRQSEVPVEGVNGEQRWRRFDATFCALLHAYHTINRLSVRQMVCGNFRRGDNTKGVFYRWVSRFGRR
ncbi:hypothetical protein PMAYCL1PPCAC_03804, partial [Pristionchus mayeri]